MKKLAYFTILSLIIGFLIGYALGTASPILDKKVAENVLKNELVRPGTEISIKDAKNAGFIDELTLEVNGKEDKLYVSPDGKVFYQKIYESKDAGAKKDAQNAASGPVVSKKTDKPKVELFVMSYCPFGTQMEKAYLPAIKALGDSIDAKVKFVNYAMHGAKEVNENVLQYCLEKEKPEKFNDYLACFLDKGKSDACLKTLGIKKEELKSCIDATNKEFSIQKDLNDKSTYLSGRYPKFKIHDDLNKKYGVEGSPTLVVNGQKIDRAGRNPQAVLDIICSAFTDDKKPKACKEKLSTKTYQPGFGYDGANNNNSASAGCGA